MIGWLAKFTPGGSLGLYAILGIVSVVSVGGIYLKVTSYVKAHEDLEAAYDRQKLELNQALQVNLHNIEEMQRLQIQHEETITVLEIQRETEITNRETVETQLTRIQRLMRETEPEIVYVDSDQTCPPAYGVHPVLANPFGRVLIQPTGGDGGGHPDPTDQG